MSADFLDSNIFVYLFDETDERKQTIAAGLIEAGIESGTGCISFQVVQETLNVWTRKLLRPATPAEATRLMDEVLLPLWRGGPSAAFYRRGLELQERHSLSFYDALIVVAALEAGCTRLLSEDLQDGLRIDRLRIENPFKS